MKYYKILIKRNYEKRLASNANFINNSKEYIFKQISNGEIILDAPIFDYFYLESFDDEKYWEWNLFDAHKFIGEASRMLGSLLISERTKELFESFKISEPHFYYQSKILYHDEKLTYYIFQFTGKYIYKELTKYIDFSKSIFRNPVENNTLSFIDIDDYIQKSDQICYEKDAYLEKEKIVLNNDLDFFPMQSFFKDNLISERLKQAIEENGITGFEFSELDYEVIVER
ncbi:hypothetical protein IF125_12785 [Empedobacter stercoris]|uniref:imm11 family protein n=1 Tax=Empedobacter stercoris TaxID=1628248 RepID=UPI001CE0EE6C|nr:hypothetical protein [Empedobacter stercoris]MCA4783118.1 hypothetical protein [Empedobacter stercoris]